MCVCYIDFYVLFAYIQPCQSIFVKVVADQGKLDKDAIIWFVTAFLRPAAHQLLIMRRRVQHVCQQNKCLV